MEKIYRQGFGMCVVRGTPTPSPEHTTRSSPNCCLEALTEASLPRLDWLNHWPLVWPPPCWSDLVAPSHPLSQYTKDTLHARDSNGFSSCVPGITGKDKKKFFFCYIIVSLTTKNCNGSPLFFLMKFKFCSMAYNFKIKFTVMCPTLFHAVAHCACHARNTLAILLLTEWVSCAPAQGIPASLRNTLLTDLCCQDFSHNLGPFQI